MKCQRCMSAEEATYRAYTKGMDMKVCGLCAAEAQKLGIAVEILGGEREQTQATTERCRLEHRRYPLSKL